MNSVVPRCAMLLGMAVSVGCGDDLPTATPSAGGSTSSTPVTSTDPWVTGGPLPLPTTGGPMVDGTSTDSGSTSEPGTTSTDSGTTAGLDATEGVESTSSPTTFGEESSDGPEPVNPVAEDDVACLVRGTAPLEVPDVLANDSDPQGSALVITDSDPVTAAGGTSTVMGDSIVYDPPSPQFWGEDSLGYTIEDPEGNSATATLRVMVWPGRIDLGELGTGEHGVTIWPDVPDGRLGWTVAGGGDLDADGLDDVVVSAPFANAMAGRVYVVYGDPAATSIDLVDVAAEVGGYVMDGEHTFGFAGWSVAILPDMNGDLRDEVVAAGAWSNFAAPQAGRIYVRFSPAMPSSIPLADLTVGGGFVIDGIEEGSWAGWDLGPVPDMNGDGIAELLLGSPRNTSYVSDPGWAYVVWGKDTTDAVSLLDLQLGVGGGFGIIGQPGDHIGFAVQGLEDVNGDGLGDVMVGSEVAADTAGRAYVLHGKADPGSLSAAAAIAGGGGYMIQGATGSDRLGYSIGEVGDIDGNGRPELLVGAPEPDGTGTGVLHVLFDSVASNIELGTVPLGEGASLPSPILGDDTGWSVTGIGDFNGDGRGDVAVGSPSSDYLPGSDSGSVYVIFGRPDMEAVNLSDVAAGRGGFVLAGDEWAMRTGWSVSGAGDFNGDGVDDMVLGSMAAGAVSPDGRAYVVYGVGASTPELGACVPPPTP